MKTYDFTFVIGEKYQYNYDEMEEISELLYDKGYNDITVSTTAGLLYLDFYRAGTSLENVLQSATAEIDALGLDIKRVISYDEDEQVSDAVFDVIKKEMEYQDKLWNNTESRGIHSIPEFILFMQNYLKEAEQIVSRTASPKCDEEASHIIRKVVAMGIQCMKQNGIYERDMEDLKNSCKLHGVDCLDS